MAGVYGYLTGDACEIEFKPLFSEPAKVLYDKINSKIMGQPNENIAVYWGVSGHFGSKLYE